MPSGLVGLASTSWRPKKSPLDSVQGSDRRRVIEEIARVANRLAELGVEGVVFVGGATVGLLLTDPAAPSARPTLDVDVVTPVTSKRAFHELELKLFAAGYSQPSGGPIRRWVIDGVIVDLMPPIDSVLGFSNRWYPELITNAVPVPLPGGIHVLIGDAPHLLATKLEAFHGRGENDYRFSRDITDIVVLVDGREELVSEMARAPVNLRQYVVDEFKALIDDPDFDEALSAHLPSDEASQERSSLILSRMRTIASLL
jgi:predicted nucleotidyltransferase